MTFMSCQMLQAMLDEMDGWMIIDDESWVVPDYSEIRLIKA